MARASFGSVHLEVSKVISVVPHAAITQMGGTAYGHSLSTMPHSNSHPLLDVDQPAAKNGGSPSKKKNRSKSVFNTPMVSTTEKVVPREKSRTVPHPVSAGPLIKAVSNPAISEMQNPDFISFPSEVIVFPLWKGTMPHNSNFGEDSLVWDLQLLTEDEVQRLLAFLLSLFVLDYFIPFLLLLLFCIGSPVLFFLSLLYPSYISLSLSLSLYIVFSALC